MSNYCQHIDPYTQTHDTLISMPGKKLINPTAQHNMWNIGDHIYNTKVWKGIFYYFLN